MTIQIKIKYKKDSIIKFDNRIFFYKVIFSENNEPRRLVPGPKRPHDEYL